MKKDYKKIAMVGIATGLALIILIMGIGLYGASLKPSNKEITLNNYREEAPKLKFEYGEEVDGEFEIEVIDKEGQQQKLLVKNLEPKVTTEEVGEKTHKGTANGESFKVLSIVEDTTAPEISISVPKGERFRFKFHKPTEEDIMEFLKDKATAEDVIDGEIPVEIELEAINKSIYKVNFKATDKNDLVTKESRELVLVRDKEKERELEKIEREKRKEAKKAEEAEQDPTPAPKPILPPVPEEEEGTKQPEIQQPEVQQPEVQQPEGPKHIKDVKTSLIPWASIDENTGYQLSYKTKRKISKDIWIKSIIITPKSSIVMILDGKESDIFYQLTNEGVVQVILDDPKSYTIAEERTIRDTLFEIKEYHKQFFN